MSKRILFLATFFIAVLVQTMAQAAPAVADSVPADTTMAGSDSNFFYRVTQRRWFQATYLGASINCNVRKKSCSVAFLSTTISKRLAAIAATNTFTS
ncbi:MAG: hypothetical protein SOU27_09695 [Sodaliphilus sp.]|nr:hypothetical protein [Sodaliphilus sp.]